MSGSYWRVGVLVAVLGGLALVGWQGGLEGADQEKGAKETLPADLARAPGKGALLMSVRVADVWMSPLGKGMRARLGKPFAEEVKLFEEKKLGMPVEELERVTLVHKDLNRGPAMMFFATRNSINRKKVLAGVVPGGKEEKYNGETFVANARDEAAFFLGDKAFVTGSRGDIQSMLDHKGKPVGGLAPALALAAKKHSVVIGVNPSALAKVEDNLPAEAAEFKPLFKAASVSMTLEVGAKTHTNVRVAFATADEAREGLKAVEAGRKLGMGIIAGNVKQMSGEKSLAAMVEMLELLEKSLKTATIERDGSTVVGKAEMKLDEKVAGVVAVDAVMRVRQAAARAQGANNLKQLGLAMHNYADRNKTFPPQAIYDKDGKALLSWRVLLLPYLDQNELYKKFKLNEAWDSPHNKKLLAEMPATYISPSGKSKHKHGTFYQGFHGKSAFFEGKRGIGIADITDGTSNTIMIVEAAKDVPWTKPEDLPFIAGKPLPKVGGLSAGGGFHAAFADGSVRFFGKIKDATLTKYITRNGGEIIGGDD